MELIRHWIPQTNQGSGTFPAPILQVRFRILSIESRQITLLLFAPSPEHLYPPFHDLEHHVIEGYAVEFVKRAEMFMNGKLEWHHVGMASCARGRMHPVCVRNSYCALYIAYSMSYRCSCYVQHGVFEMDGFPYKEEDIHSSVGLIYRSGSSLFCP